MPLLAAPGQFHVVGYGGLVARRGKVAVFVVYAVQRNEYTAAGIQSCGFEQVEQIIEFSRCFGAVLRRGIIHRAGSRCRRGDNGSLRRRFGYGRRRNLDRSLIFAVEISRKGGLNRYFSHGAFEGNRDFRGRTGGGEGFSCRADMVNPPEGAVVLTVANVPL